MSRWAWNKSDPLTKRQFFVLLRQGVSSHAAALSVGVSPSCGSLWFIDAGSVKFIDTPISSRYLSQDDRIEIADGLQAGEPVKQIAARIGTSYQSVDREINRGRKPNGVSQPYDAHARAFQQRQRPKQHRVVGDAALRAVITKKMIAGKIQVRWSPGQISRWLRRRWPRQAGLAPVRRDDLRRGLPVVTRA